MLIFEWIYSINIVKPGGIHVPGKNAGTETEAIHDCQKALLSAFMRYFRRGSKQPFALEADPETSKQLKFLVSQRVDESMTE